jgi:CHAT domain-containing protein
VYEAAGDRENAIEHYRLARDLYRAIADPQGESDTLSLIGRWHLASNQPAEALEVLRQSLAKAQAMGDRQRTMVALYWVATAERGVGELAAARAHSEGAIALSESLRGSLPDHQLRGSMLASAQRYFDFHIDLLMEMNRRQPDPALVTAALEANERSRARSLLELLTESGRDLRRDIDPALRMRDLDLEKRLDAAAERQVRVLAAARNREEAAAISNEIQNVTREHDLVEAQIRAGRPEAAAFLQPQPLTLAEIQNDVLDDQTLLLEYHIGAERSHVWAVTRETVSAYELPKGAEIEAAARRWHELLNGGPPTDAAGAVPTRDAVYDEPLRRQALALSATLIAPVAGQLRDRRLLIVADGALQYIPFAALPAPGRADAAPLIVDHEVVSAPSASLVAVLRRQLAGRSPAKKTLAVLADPVFDAEDERVGPRGPKVTATTAAPAAESRVREITRAASGVGLRDGAISRLPFTRREADAILALVPAGERMQALDFAASRATATSAELAQYRYVHFATHGFANSEHPELSGIVLSLVDAQGREQSGFLSPSQVFNLKLPAELVVLSGCRTALGKEIKGEGLLGLTRALMSAGAGRVVASLWKVDDAATAELMKTMYERILRDRQRPAQALRSAQIAMWQTRRWSAPYYWAAFVIQGEWK